MADREPLDTEFFPNTINFTTRHEHDTNKRKFYFVVPALGIFTLLSDALAWEPDQDNVTPALTMKQALGILDAHRKPPSIKREVKVEIKREELKREVSTPSPRKEKMLPLYADDEDDDEDVAPQALATFDNASNDGDVRERDGKGNDRATEMASRKRSVPVSPRGSHAKRARGGRAATVARSPPPSAARTPVAASRHPHAPPPELSPTVSSVSSLSTRSSLPDTPASHPFRNLGDSASTARGGTSAPSQSPVARPTSSTPAAHGTGTPARRGGAMASRGAPHSASAAPRDPTIHLGPGALRNFPRGEPIRYKPASLKKLVEQRASASTAASSSSTSTPGPSTSTTASTLSTSTPGPSTSGSRDAASELLLFNSVTRTVYKDAYLAVQQMATREAVQVVGLDELAEYVSGTTRKV
ncbi:hypothetical protein C8R43DRAFT_1124070 [Mycena crocata]|nr:hypothetical protein C8R43DRAFT_1124070 [Mycena crocata]